MNQHRGWVCEPRGYYPANWAEIARAAKLATGFTCEHCGMTFDETGKALDHLNANGSPAILTVHHLDGDKANCTWENLLVVCQACHLHIQARWAPGFELPAIWETAPSWLVARGLAYEPNPQLRLF